MSFIKNIKTFSQKLFANSANKKSRPFTFYEYQGLKEPVWTPRRYDSLANEGYQQNVIVYRCVNLIAKSIASVGWQLHNKGHPVTNHHLLNLLDHPNPNYSGPAFTETIVSHLLLAGNAYIEIIGNTELHTLRPDRVKVIPNASGTVEGYLYTVNNHKRVIRNQPSIGDRNEDKNRENSVLHLKSFHPLNDWYGMSPIEAAARAIDQHNAVSAHNLALLQNGGRPSGALLVKNINNHGIAWSLSEEQRSALREQIHAAYEGSTNAGRIMVLEGDYAWQEMGLSPKDLDFISGKSISAREIAQAYGVPPMLVGVAGDATFANYREARLHLWEDTIIPIMENLIGAFNTWLTPRFGKDLRLSYDIEAIPALAPKREAFWEKINNATFLTVDEKRQALGYGPIKKPKQDREENV